MCKVGEVDEIVSLRVKARARMMLRRSVSVEEGGGRVEVGEETWKVLIPSKSASS
jgi:hypothetical protein